MQRSGLITKFLSPISLKMDKGGTLFQAFPLFIFFFFGILIIFLVSNMLKTINLQRFSMKYLNLLNINILTY